jgi:hypothetical protein
MRVRGLRRLILGAAALLAVDGANAEDYRYCTKRDLRASDTSTIQLTPGVREKPAFYLRITSSPVVLFFKPEDLVAHLEEWIAKERANRPAMQRSDLQDPLDWIRHDLPLKEDTDLFKYGLRDPGFASRVEYLAADLLEAGHAAVDLSPLHTGGPDSTEPNDQFDPTTIKRVYWKTRGGDGRKYCSPDGFGILSTLETIYD